MPQMNPMSWIILFIYFIYLLYLFTLFIYFIYFQKKILSPMKNSLINNQMNWSW